MGTISASTAIKAKMGKRDRGSVVLNSSRPFSRVTAQYSHQIFMENSSKQFLLSKFSKLLERP
jgi:hypothetical protein